MTNAQKVAGLIMMGVALGLLFFVDSMWKSGRLTYALIGLVVAVVILGVGVAYWRNANAVIGFFQQIPGQVGNFLENHWATIIGLILLVGMVWVGGGMLWRGAKTAVGYGSVLTTPIAAPVTTSSVATSMSTALDTITITKTWSEWQRVPLGGGLNSQRINLGFDYEAQTASGKIYQAIDGAPFVGMEDTDRIRYRIMVDEATESEPLELLRRSPR